MDVKTTKGRVAVVLAIAGLAVLTDSARIRHVNPPVRGDIAAPAAIDARLRRACYDCHSNESVWPWYSHIAPLSWLITREMESGRRQINFSEWKSYYPATRLRKLRWLDRALSEEAMPPGYYVLLHPGAALTAADLAALQQWARSEIARQSQEKQTDKEN